MTTRGKIARRRCGWDTLETRTAPLDKGEVWNASTSRIRRSGRRCGPGPFRVTVVIGGRVGWYGTKSINGCGTSRGESLKGET